MNFLMFKLVLEKAEEQEIKLPTSSGSWKKQESSISSRETLLTDGLVDCEEFAQTIWRPKGPTLCFVVAGDSINLLV